MNRFYMMVAAALMCALPISCQQQQVSEKPTGEQEQQMEPPLHLGAVHQVYPEQGFALLRIIGPMPKSGTVLITHPVDGTNSRIGNLCVTAETAARNNIIAADIRSGVVMKGDRVFQYRNILTTENEEESSTEHPILDTVPDSAVQEMQTEAAPQEQTQTPPDLSEQESPLPAPAPVEPQPTQTESSATPPTYLDDIPDDISGWN